MTRFPWIKAGWKTILDYPNEYGIQSGGRWGGWNFSGMENTLLESQNAATTMHSLR